jgi:hypothetical protein
MNEAVRCKGRAMKLDMHSAPDEDELVIKLDNIAAEATLFDSALKALRSTLN